MYNHMKLRIVFVPKQSDLTLALRAFHVCLFVLRFFAATVGEGQIWDVQLVAVSHC